MLLFYRRVFSVDGRFLVFTRIMIALIASSGSASVLGFIFMEYPVRVQRTSVNTKAFYVALSVINIGLDLVVFGLVQFKVWRLKMNIKRKTLLSLLLLLAALYVINRPLIMMGLQINPLFPNQLHCCEYFTTCLPIDGRLDGYHL